METNFQPGIRPGIDLSIYSEEDVKIIKYLSSRDWYVTRIERISIGNSVYNVLLLKPSPSITVGFNINREVVVALSPYKKFEPRSIDAIDYLDVQELRLEEICSIIISKDEDVEKQVNQILKSNQETRVIIPFSYFELLIHINDKEYFVNKIRNKFYNRDLFGIQDPLKRDLYFFGRRDLIQNLLNRHLCGENSGVFGLRKTGKTSIIYSIERALDKKQSASLFIDCQTLHLKPWNIALYFIIQELQKKYNTKKIKIRSLKDYEDERFVSDYFLEDIKAIYRSNDKKSILLIFDEIENISFETSLSENWKSGIDFIKFWQVIRSAFQQHRNENVFTYFITGTNPRCVELSTINKIDNPLFSQFPPFYITAFDFFQTKEMLDKLGGYMGLAFDERTISNLVSDFGGHPLLIRQMCSYMHRAIVERRPYTVNKTKYESLKSGFLSDESGFLKYAQMVLEVLYNWYPDEYQMLTWLSVGEVNTFTGLSEVSPDYIVHLISYGVIEKAGNNYSFKMEVLKDYLSNKNQYKRLNLTLSEKQSEISKRRNAIEPKVRRIVKNHLNAHFGETDAKSKVIKELYGSKCISDYLSEGYSNFLILICIIFI